MKIGRTTALLAATAGIVMLGAGGAEARGSHGEGGGDQINNCTSFTLISVLGGPHVSCVNVQASGQARGEGKQVNNCQVFTPLSVGDLQILPIRSSSTTCENVRR